MTNLKPFSHETFASSLFEKMKLINPGLADLEYYEFCYALENLTPTEGWQSVTPRPAKEIEKQVNDIAFYRSIKLKPAVSNRLGLDEPIVELTRSLMAGLVNGIYSIDWVTQNFYFDIPELPLATMAAPVD